LSVPDRDQENGERKPPGRFFYALVAILGGSDGTGEGRITGAGSPNRTSPAENDPVVQAVFWRRDALVAYASRKRDEGVRVSMKYAG